MTASEADLLACVRISGRQWGANSFYAGELAAELKCSVPTARRRINALYDSRLVFPYDKAGNTVLWEVTWYHPEMYERMRAEVRRLQDADR